MTTCTCTLCDSLWDDGPGTMYIPRLHLLHEWHEQKRNEHRKSSKLARKTMMPLDLFQVHFPYSTFTHPV